MPRLKTHLRKNTNQSATSVCGRKIDSIMLLDNPKNVTCRQCVARMTTEQLETRNRPARMVVRRNLMSGIEYVEAEDTPLCCSPASETYWSM